MSDTKKCRCGRTFQITPKDRKYYAARGWELPRHCPACRFDRRPLRGGMFHQLGGEFRADKQEAWLGYRHN